MNFPISKKSIHILFGSVLLSLLLPVAAFAAEGLIYFSDPQAKVGEDVDVEMTIQADGSILGDATVTLKYPADSLQFLNGAKTSGGAGTLIVKGKGNAVSDSRWTYLLTFKVLKAGELSVSISNCEVYDASGSKIKLTHLGSSTVSSSAADGINSDLLLSSLEISPGKLDPDFSPVINDYNVTVGLSVERLTIKALPADNSNIVDVLNNEDLKEGENLISVIVKPKDGTEQNEYRIKVLKTEGGEENLMASTPEETTAESVSGVQLSCKGKTITIMDPDDSVAIPEGFRGSTIKIDGQPVQGWITGESEKPEYFLVYGMNDAGELNFYRYDRAEKTIQRYFAEEKEKAAFTEEEYLALQKANTELNDKYEKNRLILCILAVILFLAVCLVIYLIVRLSSANKELDALYAETETDPRHGLDPQKSRRRSGSSSRFSDRNEEDDDYYSDDEDDEEYNDEDGNLSRNQKMYHTSTIRGLSTEDRGRTAVTRRTEASMDETKVLRHGERRRSSRKALSSYADTPVSDETTVIRRESSRRRNSRHSEYEE